ncbi:uncharacterized protein LOC142538739 [Primulina tabacum]|uniref:uncharacterized protein LOC142538739 n=1 Tax=Primulina tabacum TaxID=48773 RepID=UPI003F5A4117
MASFNKILRFPKEDYDDWKVRMQAHLAAQDDDIWYIITDGPMKILKVNTAAATIEGAPQMVEKHRSEWTADDKKKANMDNVAKDILYKTLDKNMFAKIKTCTTAKEIWKKLTQLCEGNDQTKERKLNFSIQKFDNAKMKPGETLTEFDERFSGIIIELISLGKDYCNGEIALKVLRALPREWDVKTIAMHESKDINKLELHDLFADLKAYEFELGIRTEEEPSTSQQTKALAATTVTLPVEESTNLVTALHDMVNEFKRLSQQFNEAKTEKQNLKNKLTLSSCSQQKEATKKKELEESIWLLDSGCSRHMTGNKDLLSEIVNYKGPTITFGDNSKGRAVGKCKIIHGKVIIKDENKFAPHSKAEEETHQQDVWNSSTSLLHILNQLLSSYLEDHGIKHELSAARSPQQNGVAERRNRTLMEAARTMLAESNISQRFWAEAINTACYT